MKEVRRIICVVEATDINRIYQYESVIPNIMSLEVHPAQAWGTGSRPAGAAILGGMLNICQYPEDSCSKKHRTTKQKWSHPFFLEAIEAVTERQYLLTGNGWTLGAIFAYVDPRDRQLCWYMHDNHPKLPEKDMVDYFLKDRKKYDSYFAMLWFFSTHAPFYSPKGTGDIESSYAFVDKQIGKILDKCSAEAEIWVQCYDEETEILTKDGWKHYDELTYDDKVATLNKDGFIEYHKPERIIISEYEGEMYEFAGRRISLLVTPNHKLYVKLRKNGRDRTNYIFVEARDAYAYLKTGKTTGLMFKKGAKWRGLSRETFVPYKVRKVRCQRCGHKWDTLYCGIGKRCDKCRGMGHLYFEIIEEDRLYPIDIWLKFLGYWLSDGTLYINKEKGAYEVMIKQSKRVHPEKYEEIVDIFKEMGYRPYHYGRSIKVYDKRLVEYLKSYWKTKKVPNEIKELDSDKLKILLEYLIKGDGYENGSRKCFGNTSEPLIDDFQEIALKTGYSATIGVNKSRPSKIGDRIMHPSRTQYLVTVSDLNSTEIRTCRKVEYSGIVWCVTIPNHVVYVRRRGKSCWCGNSDHGVPPSGVSAAYDLPAAKTLLSFVASNFSGDETKSWTELEVSGHSLAKRKWK